MKYLQAYLSVWFHFFPPLRARTHTQKREAFNKRLCERIPPRISGDLCYVSGADDITAWSDFSRKEHITVQEVKHNERHWNATQKLQSPRLPITKTANTTQQLCGRHGSADRAHHHRHMSVHSRWCTFPSSLTHTEPRRPPAQNNYRRLNFRRRRLPSFHLHYERPLTVEKSNWPTHRWYQVTQWNTVLCIKAQAAGTILRKGGVFLWLHTSNLVSVRH